ncbi:hypothetical protein CSCA_4532 [Clostridium scatologenes]|uniref:Uncharacterized protein n=1 Tax=Clostridium scatologenes TaxID=1548 RepID=A0A0E3MA27_CLOSL|nr:hypothetical protein CSCA_4532 [Clostridium scatologenes]
MNILEKYCMDLDNFLTNKSSLYIYEKYINKIKNADFTTGYIQKNFFYNDCCVYWHMNCY